MIKNYKPFFFRGGCVLPKTGISTNRFGPQNDEIGSDHQTKHIIDIIQTGLKC